MTRGPEPSVTLPVEDPGLSAARMLLRRGRGMLRLARFAAIAARTLSDGRVRRPLAPAEAALIGRDVAREIVGKLGIDVTTEGAPPPELHLLVSNHRSYMDIPVLMSSAPGIFLAKHEIESWPLVGTLAARLGTIFVEREVRASRKRALAAMREVLSAGTSVALFPEGTTSRGPGVLPFRPGSFWLAAELGLPVVPAAVSYARPSNAWIDDDPFVGHFLRELSAPKVEIRVSFGPPLRGRDGFALRGEARDWIRRTLAPRDAEAFRSSGASSLPRDVRLPLFDGLAPIT